MDSYQVVSVSTVPKSGACSSLGSTPRNLGHEPGCEWNAGRPAGLPKQSWSEWISFRRRNFPWK